MKSHYIQKHDKNGIRMKETIACRHHTCVIPLSSSFSSHLQKKTPLSQPAHPPSLLLASSFFKLSPSAQSHYSTHFSSPVSALSRRTSHFCIFSSSEIFFSFLSIPTPPPFPTSSLQLYLFPHLLLATLSLSLVISLKQQIEHAPL